MPERANLEGSAPKYTRVQSLRGGLILEEQFSEKKKAVEPARFADLEKPRKVPQKAEPVWTAPVEDSKPQPTEYKIVKRTELRKVKKPKKEKITASCCKESIWHKFERKSSDQTAPGDCFEIAEPSGRNFGS